MKAPLNIFVIVCFAAFFMTVGYWYASFHFLSHIDCNASFVGKTVFIPEINITGEIVDSQSPLLYETRYGRRCEYKVRYIKRYENLNIINFQTIYVYEKDFKVVSQ